MKKKEKWLGSVLAICSYNFNITYSIDPTTIYLNSFSK